MPGLDGHVAEPRRQVADHRLPRQSRGMQVGGRSAGGPHARPVVAHPFARFGRRVGSQTAKSPTHLVDRQCLGYWSDSIIPASFTTLLSPVITAPLICPHQPRATWLSKHWSECAAGT